MLYTYDSGQMITRCWNLFASSMLAMQLKVRVLSIVWKMILEQWIIHYYGCCAVHNHSQLYINQIKS